MAYKPEERLGLGKMTLEGEEPTNMATLVRWTGDGRTKEHSVQALA